MTKHKFVQIELTSTEHNDNLINNMLSNFSEELSKMQEKIVIEHLKTFIEYLVVVRGVCDILDSKERHQLVDDYVKWVISTLDKADELIREFEAKSENGEIK